MSCSGSVSELVVELEDVQNGASYLDTESTSCELIVTNSFTKP